MQSLGVDDGTGWGGGFFWGNGGAATYDGESSFGAFMNTSFFEWQIVCGWSTCNGDPLVHTADLAVNSIRLFVQETGGPSITATSPLDSETGWIRGNGWPLSFQTDDPSGVCHVAATVGPTDLSGRELEPGPHGLASVLGHTFQPDGQHRPITPMVP